MSLRGSLDQIAARWLGDSGGRRRLGRSAPESDTGKRSRATRCRERRDRLPTPLRPYSDHAWRKHAHKGASAHASEVPEPTRIAWAAPLDRRRGFRNRPAQVRAPRSWLMQCVVCHSKRVKVGGGRLSETTAGRNHRQPRTSDKVLAWSNGPHKLSREGFASPPCSRRELARESVDRSVGPPRHGWREIARDMPVRQGSGARGAPGNLPPAAVHDAGLFGSRGLAILRGVATRTLGV